MGQASQIDWWRVAENADTPSLVRSAPDAAIGSGVAFSALIGFTVMLVVAPQEFIPLLGALRLAFLFAIVAIAAQIFGGSTGATVSRTPVELKLAAGLVALAILSIATSYWPSGSVETLTGRYLKSIAVFWLIGAVVSSVSRLRALLWTLAVASIPLALVAVNDFLSGTFVRDRVVGYDSGLASNPNDLALTLNLFLPLTAMLAVTAQRAWVRAFAWGTAGLSITAILITFSRGGFLTLVAEGIFLAVFLIRLGARRAVWTLALLSLLTLVAVPAGYGQRVSTILDIDSDPTGSAQDRWRDTVAATRFITAHPIVGAGLGQGILALNEARGALWVTVHNTYLNYGVDLGIPGLLLFVALVTASYRGARRVARMPTNAVGFELVAFAAGIGVSLIGFTVAAFFYPVAYHFYFYYIAGLSVAVNRTAARQFGMSFASV